MTLRGPFGTLETSGQMEGLVTPIPSLRALSRPILPDVVPVLLGPRVYGFKPDTTGVVVTVTGVLQELRAARPGLGEASAAVPRRRREIRPLSSFPTGPGPHARSCACSPGAPLLHRGAVHVAPAACA